MSCKNPRVDIAWAQKLLAVFVQKQNGDSNVGDFANKKLVL